MFDIKIKKEDIKSFFFKKYKEKGIISKRVLGITTQYARGIKYKDFLGILFLAKPIIDDNVDELINDYKNKVKKNKISAKTFLKDKETMQKIVEKIDPKKLPKSTGFFRELQLETLQLAKEIMEDIQKNTDIKIWIDGGSLLGAVRHDGFIPWDDDMDFSMMRDDYKKFCEYVKNKYTIIDTSNWTKKSYKKNITKLVAEYENKTIAMRLYNSFKFVRGDKNRFATVDFFAWDCYNEYHNVVTLQRYCEEIKTKLKAMDSYKEIFELFNQELEKGVDIVKDSNVIAPGIDNHGLMYYARKEIVRKNDIFPLVTIKFEDTEFLAPNNQHVYLKSMFNFYNKIPLNGLCIARHMQAKNIIS